MQTEVAVLGDQLDLDVAGEFLVMAATLIQIKSRMLLPADVEEEERLDGVHVLDGEALRQLGFLGVATTLGP